MSEKKRRKMPKAEAHLIAQMKMLADGWRRTALDSDGTLLGDLEANVYRRFACSIEQALDWHLNEHGGKG